jgi:hypothetical protein
VADDDETYRTFSEVVNMTSRELQRWLETDSSKSVGVAGGETKSGADRNESVGHESGRRIVEITSKKEAELSADDYDHMRKVVGYVHRHLAQRPEKEAVEDSRWRYSLMNWGHDPLKA